MAVPTLTRITCDNPSPMTLEGTNTYIISAEGASEAVIVDPGPQGHHDHLHAVLNAVGGRSVTEILVTHRHRDHTGAAKEFSARTGAPVRGYDADHCLPVQGTVLPLMDGEEIQVAGVSLQVLHTPGHTSDSVCFWIPQAQVEAATEPGAMLTGDTILGEGTTMLDHPDGTLSDYMESLRLLGGFGGVGMCPAHGPEREDLSVMAGRYLKHREERLAQTRELIAEHRARTDEALDAGTLGRLIYGERAQVPERVIEQIAASQLAHLRDLGEI